jgi:hypothetical protein
MLLLLSPVTMRNHYVLLLEAKSVATSVARNYAESLRVATVATVATRIEHVRVRVRVRVALSVPVVIPIPSSHTWYP